MFKKQYKIIFIVSIAIFTFLFTFLISESNLKKTEIPTGPFSIKNTISITVIVGDATLHLVSQAGSSLYEALVSGKNSSYIEFSGKNYSGLGFFMTDIETFHSGDGKYLFYYINGKEASVGVSSYLPKDGDIIEWKLK